MAFHNPEGLARPRLHFYATNPGGFCASSTRFQSFVALGRLKVWLCEFQGCSRSGSSFEPARSFEATYKAKIAIVKNSGISGSRDAGSNSCTAARIDTFGPCSNSPPPTTTPGQLVVACVLGWLGLMAAVYNYQYEHYLCCCCYYYHHYYYYYYYDYYYDYYYYYDDDYYYCCYCYCY